MQMKELGWNTACEEYFGRSAGFPRDAFPARVAFASRGLWKLAGMEGDFMGRLSGKALNDRECPTPVVGDWVAATRLDGENAIIHAVMPRQSVLARGEAGGRKRKNGYSDGGQVLAANVTLSLIVCGLDRDYNPRRIERYIAMSYGGGVLPVVLLNKADLCDKARERVGEVQALSPGVTALMLSALDGQGVEDVRALLRAGDTVCLLGSSGAGKSTLLNSLALHQRQTTRPTSVATGKGRHTTTHRELFTLPGGAVVIDTPGLREVALFDDDGLEQAFPEIERLAQQCRFRDCAHEGEPGCAILAAAEQGEISRERWESFLRLRREARYHQRAGDPALAAKEKARWKMLHKSLKHHHKYKV